MRSQLEKIRSRTRKKWREGGTLQEAVSPVYGAVSSPVLHISSCAIPSSPNQSNLQETLVPWNKVLKEFLGAVCCTMAEKSIHLKLLRRSDSGSREFFERRHNKDNNTKRKR